MPAGRDCALSLSAYLSPRSCKRQALQTALTATVLGRFSMYYRAFFPPLPFSAVAPAFRSAWDRCVQGSVAHAVVVINRGKSSSPWNAPKVSNGSSLGTAVVLSHNELDARWHRRRQGRNAILRRSFLRLWALRLSAYMKAPRFLPKRSGDLRNCPTTS